MRAKVLIVDDDRSLLRSLREFLEREGIATDTAGDGVEAQALLGKGDYDVAVVDLWMPGVDGFALLEWLQENTPRVVPLVLSGSQSIEDAVNAVRRGAFDFVSKPVFDLNVFVQHVERALAHKRLLDSHERLVAELQRKTVELENRLSQLELAHSTLKSHATYMQADLNRAMQIQHAMLPKRLPFPERLSGAVIYKPAGKIGGDLYGFYELDDHRMGAFVADTTGHGVSSAMLTVFLSHVIQPVRKEGRTRHVVDPGEILRDLNHMLYEEAFGGDMFISMAYLIIDTRTYSVHFATAGHPPILVRRKDGSVEAFHVPAPALGINPKVKFTTDKFTLEEGESILLYTDGLLDVRSMEGEFFGAQRLRELMASIDAGPEALKETIKHEIEAFAGHDDRFEDDVTIVALGAQPQTTPFVGTPPVELTREEAAAGELPVDVLTACHDDRVFVSVSGAGSWRESQRLLDVCRHACQTGERSVVVDFSRCTHLDSTFLGALHTLVSRFEDHPACRFEIQNLPRTILREMSELGLAGVLMHFRPDPVPLPKGMHHVEGETPAGARMSRLLLRAHEALVEADPRNADRFAAVLKLLHEQANGIDSKDENNGERKDHPHSA